jgi:hypothetical protein
MKDSIFIGDGWTRAEGGGRRPTVDSDRRGEDVGEGQRWWPGGRDGVVAGEGNGWTGAEGGGRRPAVDSGLRGAEVVALWGGARRRGARGVRSCDLGLGGGGGGS